MTTEPYPQFVPPEYESFTEVGPYEILDDRHRIQRYYIEGEFIGFHELHLRDDGLWCGGYVAWKVTWLTYKMSGHQLVTAEPLHVEPSLGCRTCPSHGYIRDGKWVPA
jgi:hypothetical protein